MNIAVTGHKLLRFSEDVPVCIIEIMPFCLHTKAVSITGNLGILLREED